MIHSITNYVTANDCANILLSCGASPIMSDDPSEVEDIASLASAVCLNLGTLNDRKLEAMMIAGRTANALSRPVILDPVGVGASLKRTASAQKILEDVNISVIRGNLSEIRALSGERSASGGVDAARSDLFPSDRDGEAEFVSALAKKLDTTIAVTGVVDIVSDGERVAFVKNGHPMMRAVTGTGCQLSAVTAAFAAVTGVTGDVMTAASAAAAAFGLCGEIAHERLSTTRGGGSGSYRAYIIDAMYNLTPDALDKGAKYEVR